MGISKVDYNGKTIIDVSRDTVTPETLVEGITAHNANGDQIVGRFVPGSSTGGGGIIDVTKLPTDNIDENAVYRTVTQVQEATLDVWAVEPSGVWSLREMNYNFVFNVITELSDDMEVSDMDGDTLYPYILESTGVVYLNVLGIGVLPVGYLFFESAGFDKGWIEDIESLDVTNPENYGIYTTREVIKDVVRLYSYRNSQWKELTAVTYYNNKLTSLSGEYSADEVIEVTQPSYTVDVIQYVVENNSIPKIVVNAPKVSELLEGWSLSGDISKEYFKKDSYNNYAFDLRNGAFMDTNITSIELPPHNYMIPYMCFYSCDSLKTIKFSENIREIAESAFEDCINLELNELPDTINYISAKAFSNCQKLAITKLPSSLTHIDSYTFQYCIGISSIEIPETVYGVFTGAFVMCTNLQTVTFKGTPSNSISEDAFYGCENITVINVPWSEGAKRGAPWGAINATINYNYTGE